MKRRPEKSGSELPSPYQLWKEIKSTKGAGKLGRIMTGLKKESTLGPVLDREAKAALKRMESADPSLKQLIRRSAGYAIFPQVEKVSAVLGGAAGLGEVVVQGQLTGYAALIEASVGLQAGKRVFQELVVFADPIALEDFKKGQIRLTAGASAAIVKWGAGSTSRRSGTKVFVQPKSGVGVEADIGGQKFVYVPAAVGKIRSAFEPAKAALKENFSHFGKPTNPNIPPKGGPIVPVRRSAQRTTARRNK